MDHTVIWFDSKQCILAKTQLTQQSRASQFNTCWIFNCSAQFAILRHPAIDFRTIRHEIFICEPFSLYPHMLNMKVWIQLLVKGTEKILMQFSCVYSCSGFCCWAVRLFHSRARYILYKRSLIFPCFILHRPR